MMVSNKKYIGLHNAYLKRPLSQNVFFFLRLVTPNIPVKVGWQAHAAVSGCWLLPATLQQLQVIFLCGWYKLSLQCYVLARGKTHMPALWFWKWQQLSFLLFKLLCCQTNCELHQWKHYNLGWVIRITLVSSDFSSHKPKYSTKCVCLCSSDLLHLHRDSREDNPLMLMLVLLLYSQDWIWMGGDLKNRDDYTQIAIM